MNDTTATLRPRWRMAALALALGSTIPTLAAAQEAPAEGPAGEPVPVSVIQGSWTTATPLTIDVEGSAPEIFLRFLTSELVDRLVGRTYVAPRKTKPCGDPACGSALGQAIGVDVILLSSLTRLGSTIHVQVQLVEVATQEVVRTLRMKVDRVADLDVVAERIAIAIVRDLPIEKTAGFGKVTHREANRKPLQWNAAGPIARLGLIVPTFGSYGGTPVGELIDIGASFETEIFALNPWIGFRFDGDSGDFLEIPLGGDGVFFLGNADIAGYLLAGASIRMISLRGEDSAWCFGPRAGAGLMFFRSYGIRLTADMTYEIGIARLAGQIPQQSLNFSIGFGWMD